MYQTLLNNQASAWLSDSRFLSYQIILFENIDIFGYLQISKPSNLNAHTRKR